MNWRCLASQGGGVTVNLKPESRRPSGSPHGACAHRRRRSEGRRMRRDGIDRNPAGARVSVLYDVRERHSLREYRRHGRSPRCGDFPDSLQPLLSADDEERCSRRGPARCPVERVVWWRRCHVSNRDNVAIDDHVDHATGPERVGIAKPASGSIRNGVCHPAKRSIAGWSRNRCATGRWKWMSNDALDDCHAGEFPTTHDSRPQ